MRKILFPFCVLVLLSWMGGAVENSLAHPSDHSHKHISSHSMGHQHHNKNAQTGKFYCPMHKHRSLTPCPHQHSQKEMAHPKQCKIAPDCGGSPVKPVPAHSGFDNNPALMTDSILLDLPGIIGTDSSLRAAYDDPPLNSLKHPPKSL
jgi:hypothetical protein